MLARRICSLKNPPHKLKIFNTSEANNGKKNQIEYQKEDLWRTPIGMNEWTLKSIHSLLYLQRYRMTPQKQVEMRHKITSKSWLCFFIVDFWKFHCRQKQIYNEKSLCFRQFRPPAELAADFASNGLLHQLMWVCLTLVSCSFKLSYNNYTSGVIFVTLVSCDYYIWRHPLKPQKAFVFFSLLKTISGLGQIPTWASQVFLPEDNSCPDISGTTWFLDKTF